MRDSKYGKFAQSGSALSGKSPGVSSTYQPKKRLNQSPNRFNSHFQITTRIRAAYPGHRIWGGGESQPACLVGFFARSGAHRVSINKSCRGLHTSNNHQILLTQISRLRISEESDAPPLQIQKIGITLKLIRFGQVAVEFISVQVLQLKGPESSRSLVFPNILAGQKPVKVPLNASWTGTASASRNIGTRRLSPGAGLAATHANLVGCQGGQGEYLSHPKLVEQVVTKAVGEPVVDPPGEIAHLNPTGIVGAINASRLSNTVFLVPKFEAMQVPIRPAHGYLEDVMPLG